MEIPPIGGVFVWQARNPDFIAASSFDRRKPSIEANWPYSKKETPFLANDNINALPRRANFGSKHRPPHPQPVNPAFDLWVASHEWRLHPLRCGEGFSLMPQFSH